MNIKLFIAFIAAVLSFPLTSSAQKICGRVLDESGAPVIAVSIYLESEPATGTISDLNGFFSFEEIEFPETLVFSHIYLEEKRLAFDKAPSDTITVVMNEYNHMLMVSTVFAQSPISRQSAVSILEPFDIYFEPQSQGDPLKAISTLPGATNTDENAMPAFRGSSADRSLVLLNGTPVHNPVKSKYLNNQGLFSLFNPEIIGSEYVHSSNPPLSYGNACSGLIDIQTCNHIEQDQLQISAGLSSVGAFGAKRLGSGKSFVQAYYNYQFSDAMVGLQKKSFPNIDRFDYHDGGLNIYAKNDSGLELKSFTYFIKEHFNGIGHSLSYTGPIYLNSLRIFTANNLKRVFKSSILSANFGFDHERPEINFGNINNKSTSSSLTSSINYKVYHSDEFSSQTGVSLEKNRYTLEGNLPTYYYSLGKEAPVEKQDVSVENTILEAYTFLNYDITPNLLATGGLRSRIPTSKEDKYYLSWQASLKYSFSPTDYLLLGGGTYNSFMTPYYNVPAYYHMQTRQVAIDYHTILTLGEIHAAMYYKKEHGFLNYDPIMSLSGSKAVVTGAEISYKKDLNAHFHLSLSDAYIHQDITIGDKDYTGPSSLNYLLKGTLTYSSSDNLNISLSYTGHPGQLYHSISGAIYDNAAEAYQPIFDEIYSKRYRNYNRIDVSISKYIAMGAKSMTIYASVNNIFDAKNPDYVYYNSDFSKEIFDHLQKRNIYFGVVLYFTK